MYLSDPKTTMDIKNVLSKATKAKFAKSQPEKYKAPPKLLPVRGLTADGTSVPLGITKKDRTVPIKKLSDNR